METWWRIELFNGPRARSGDIVVSRFYSQKVGQLLAYIALHHHRVHSREALADLLWPDAEPENARLNLRVGLASLRRQLEPPGVPKASIILATRETVQLHPDHVTTDVAEFQDSVRAAEAPDSSSRRVSLLETADSLSSGEFLPGCYADWALAERSRLDDIRRAALDALREFREQSRDFNAAFDYAHRVLAFDTSVEESHCSLIRLYLQTGQIQAAARQYRAMERALKETLHAEPSRSARELLAGMKSALELQARPSTPGAAASVEHKPPDVGPPVRTRPPAAELPALPVVFTRFFGRETELDELERMLLHESTIATAPRCSLVTVTGPGGAGKSRLAIEAAHRLAPRFNGSTLFVSLSEVTTSQGVTEAILAALPQAGPKSGEPFEQILSCLASQPSLLILDNFEQLLTDPALADACASVITGLRSRAPNLTCLVTSRQPLNVGGEAELVLQPLPTPLHPGMPERLLEFAGVQLFVDRAQAARTDFQITAGNADAIVKLCRRLEGIPLALELAAAWARILTPAQMLERLSSGLDMLVSRRRDIPARHRTLRAAIDWSYQLLSPELQRCFTNLSVFKGGWTAEAAEAVCGPLSSGAATQLMSLCESSLIVSSPSNENGQRFTMLETLREFAEEHLPDAERAISMERHAAYYQQLARAANVHYAQSDAALWMDLLQEEHENLEAALDWALGGANIEAGVEMAQHLDWYWFTRGSREARIRRVDQVAALIPRLGAYRPRAMLWAARFREHDECKRLNEQSLRMFRARKDEAGIADSLYALGSMAVSEQDYGRAERLLTESLVRRKLLADTRAIFAVRAALAHVCREQGEFNRAQALLSEQLKEQIEVGNIDGAAKVRIALANMAIERGDLETAAPMLQASLETYRRIGQRWGVGDSLRNLGSMQFAQGSYGAAGSTLNDSLEVFRSIDDTNMIGLLLMDIASNSWHLLDDDSALRYIEMAEATGPSAQSLCTARITSLRAMMAIEHGGLATAASLLDRAINDRKEPRRSSAAAWMLYRRAYLSLHSADLDSARASLLGGIRCARAIGLTPLCIRLLLLAAWYLTLEKRAERSVMLLSIVEQLLERCSHRLTPRETKRQDNIKSITAANPEHNASSQPLHTGATLEDGIRATLRLLT